MNKRILELALKKQRLQFTCAAQRLALAEKAASWRPVLSVVDHLCEAGRWIRHHPMVVVGVTTILLIARPKLMFSGLTRAIVFWKLARNTQSVIRKWLPRKAL